MGKVYCCVTNCHNNSDTYVNGRKLKLHRFPQQRALLGIWKRRVSRQFFKVSPHTRICCEHFKNGEGRTKDVDLPSIFPHKIYKTSKV